MFVDLGIVPDADTGTGQNCDIHPALGDMDSNDPVAFSWLLPPKGLYFCEPGGFMRTGNHDVVIAAYGSMERRLLCRTGCVIYGWPVSENQLPLGVVRIGECFRPRVCGTARDANSGLRAAAAMRLRSSDDSTGISVVAACLLPQYSQDAEAREAGVSA